MSTYMIHPLFTPPDLEAAYEEWGCNCGPAALAALLGKSCAEIRPFLGDFERRGYANPTHLLTALKAMGVYARWGGKNPPPRRGLLFIQLGGPWLEPGVPVGAAYRHTHHIAVDGDVVFDVNAGHWVSWETWAEPEGGVMAFIMDNHPKCDGTWSVRSAIEVPR